MKNGFGLFYLYFEKKILVEKFVRYNKIFPSDFNVENN